MIYYIYRERGLNENNIYLKNMRTNKITYDFALKTKKIQAGDFERGLQSRMNHM